MTQEEIKEYNKRCAEFLGMYDYSMDNEYFEKGNYYCYPEKEKNPGSGYYTIVQNTSDGYYGIFNSDWNWIMEVVEAIEKLGYESLIGGSEYYYPEKGMRYIQSFIKDDVTIYQEAKTKKEAVVQAINQFLIWYNENNK